MLDERPLRGKTRSEVQEFLENAIISKSYRDFDIVRYEMIYRLDGKRPKNWHKITLNLSISSVFSYSPSSDPASEYCKIRDKIDLIYINFGKIPIDKFLRKISIYNRQIKKWNTTYPTAEFIWPSTITIGGGGPFDPGDPPEESPLKILGYKVGKSGISDNARRAILARAFSGNLPSVKDAQYMLKWGDPSTPDRLHQIAVHIASLARNCKRNNEIIYKYAISDWEDDLKFLKVKFYIGHFRFPWPAT